MAAKGRRRTAGSVEDDSLIKTKCWWAVVVEVAASTWRK
jgi:hypothetical protein